MQKLTLSILILLLATVSCERLRTLQTSGSSSHLGLNCKNWDTQKETCIECFEGCTKWQNICVKIVEHCAKWDEEGNCTNCESGYGDTQGKSVNGSCPKQPPKTNQTAPTQPKQKPPTTNLGAEKKQPQIPLVDIHCQCHTEDRVCIDCFEGYYLDLNATCEEVPENCTAANEFGECTACVKGFVVQNGTCVQQECDLALCTAFNADQTQCTACSYRSYLQNGCCVQVNGFCSKWVEATGECTACYEGYSIDKNNNKQCIPTPQ